MEQKKSRADELIDTIQARQPFITPVLQIAMACHEANRALCLANGDTSQKHWEDAEEWQKESAMMGVRFRLANPQSSPGAQHTAWMNDKIAAGWVYGEVKDAEKKTHPSLVPFTDLSRFEQKKDAVFIAIVDALK